MSAIIQSLLDTDLYKFTMLQVVLHKFPQTHSVYHFRCRNLDETVYPLVYILQDLNEQLDYLCQLRFKEDELQYLRSLRFIKSDFVDYLELFQLKRRFIHAGIDSEGRLDIWVEGPMVQAMMFEIFVLAIVNELYFQRIRTPEVLEEGQRRLTAKIEFIQQCEQQQRPEDPPFLVSDFGTRRRYSLAWQRQVIQAFHQAVPNVFRGTSNVLLAKELGISPIGTMAHEFLQAFQALDVRLRDFQKAALETWVQEYPDQLGIALTDCITMDAFLRDFGVEFASRYQGLRHDSGDPVEWGEKAIAHYEKLVIDPQSKTLVFSDNLDLRKAVELYRHFSSRVQLSFGIGTRLTCDIPQVKPLNIVIKLVECNGKPVAKLSDSPGKTICHDKAFVRALRKAFDLPHIKKAS